MGKPVIILADTDEKYLAPLEIKFLEELGDSVELEVITDENYFNEHFSTPKNASIVIVSEDLYSHSLQRHNISNIFVLTEQMDEISTGDLGITKIFKYTSIKEIYKEVMALSKGFGTGDKSKTKETVVALIYSASGGTGKTTLGMGICASLVSSYNKVLYINAQRINSFQHLLDNQSALPGSIYSEFSNISDNIFNRIRHVIRTERFDYLPPFSTALSAVNIDYSIYYEIIKSAKATKEYDVIIVDTDVTFDSEKALLISQADKVVFVTEQSKASVFAMNVLMKNINCNDSDKFCFVCNKFNSDKPNALVSGEIQPNFVVNEYVKYIENIDSMTLTTLSHEPDIQKISFLIV